MISRLTDGHADQLALGQLAEVYCCLLAPGEAFVAGRLRALCEAGYWNIDEVKATTEQALRSHSDSPDPLVSGAMLEALHPVKRG
ncbi:MAG TPA: hypothetical protein VIN58_21925 [Roseateles sp.]